MSALQLQAEAPCQFSHDEMNDILASGIAQTQQSAGISHEELKNYLFIRK